MKKKILTMQFRHETNVFCPRKADRQAFENVRFLTGLQIFEDQKGVRAETGAFIDVFLNREDVELIPTVALYASPCGMVTTEVYEFATRELVKAIEAHSPLDAVLLDFHGAMVAEGHPDGEGDMLELIRQMVGWDIPIIVPLDLHANITEKMAKCADVLLPYNTYPHIDIYETGLAAANLMDQVLKGQVKPTMAYRRVAFQLPLFPSEDPQIAPLYRLAKEMESRPGVLHVRFAHGFYPADISEVGISALVITDGDQALAECLVEELEEAIKKQLPQLTQNYMSLDDALDRALLPGNGPVVIADTSDNPGAGGMGDTTHILRRILERGITGSVVAAILDEKSVEVCAKAGVGAKVDLTLGGWSDESYSGGPLQVTAHVKMLSDGKYRNSGLVAHGMVSDHGKTAVVEIGGNTVFITSFPKQVMDPEIFRKHGFEPEKENLLVVKSTIHYKASFGSFSREMIPVVVPGYAPPTPDVYTYKNWNN